MLPVLMVLVVALSSLWVYFDAVTHHVGKIPGRKTTSILQPNNMHAGAWAVATLGLWIVTFPFYLWQRKALLALAAESPVEVGYGNRALSFAGLAVLGCAWVLGTARGNAAVFVLPACDAQEVTKLVDHVFQDIPAVQSGKVSIVSVSDQKELSHDVAMDVRTCSALLATSQSPEAFKYAISWQNRAKGMMQVQIVR